MAASATIGLLRVLLTANSGEFDAAMKKASNSAKVWSKDLKNIGQQASTIGLSMSKAITLPILAVGAGALKAATDFEDSFAGIRKTVGDATDSMGKLTPVGAALAQGMRDLAKTIPINVNELNRIGEAAGQLGIRSQNIIGFTDVMAKLGVTTNLSSDQAATSLARFANIMDATKVAAGTFEFDRLGSTIVGLGNNFATTEAEITEFSLRIAGAGKLAGLAEHEVLAIGTAMASVGVEAESGGTSVQKVLNNLTEAVATGGEKLELFASTAGMTAQQFADLYRRDAAGAFQAFVEGLGTQGDKAFGTLNNLGLGNERVIRAFLSLGNAGDLLSRTFQQSEKDWNENIALTKEAEQRFGTFTSQSRLLWAQVRDLGITIGTALLPMFRDALSAAQPLIAVVASLANWFASLPQPVRLAGVAFLGIAAATGPVLYGFGQMAIAGSGLVQAFTAGGIATRALTFAFPALGAAASGAAVGVTLLRVALAGIGIGLVIAGLSLLIDKLRSVGKTVEDVTGKSMKQMVDGTGRAIMTLDEAKKAAAELGGEIITGLNAPLILGANAMTQKASPAAKTLTAALAATRAEVANLSKAQREQLIAGVKMGLSTKDLHEAFQKLYPQVKLSEAGIELFKEELAESTKKTEDATKATEKWNESISRSIARLTPFKTAIADVGQEIRNLRHGLDRDGNLITQSIQETSDASAEAAKELKAWADAHGAHLAPAMREFSGSLNTSKGEIQGWRDSLGDALSSIPDTLMRAFEGGGSLAGAFASIGVQIGKSIMEPLTKEWGKFQKLASGVGSSVAAGVGGAVGGSTLATVAGLAGSIGGAALATTAFGAAMTTAIGATAALGVATAGVGLAVVGVVAAYKKWFTVSPEVKKAREEVKKFEDAIIDSLSATQKAQAGGERWAEVLIGVRDTFLQTGRSAQDAERLVGQMFDTDNPERAREAIALIGEAYTELAEIQRIVAEGTEEANGIFQDLEAQAALMGNTMPDSLRPMIDRLVEMGVVSEETAARLGRIGAEGDVNFKAMEATAKEFGIEVGQLGDKFQGARLAEDAQKIWRGFQLLTKGGTDANVVLGGMRDEITNLVRDSLKFGIAIPENFRPFIEQLEASGGLVDENGERLTDLSGLKFGPPIVDQWQMIGDKLSELIDKITTALPRAINNIPDGEFDVRVRVDDRALRDFNASVGINGGVDVQGFARGSQGIRDFGSGELAMLHGREGVFTEAQIAAIEGQRGNDHGVMDAIADQTRQLTGALRSILSESRYITKLGTRDAAMGAV